MWFEKLKGRRLGYKMAPERFNSNNPTIVLIHGAGGCTQVWQAQIHPLQKHVNLLAIDLPGHGETGGAGMETISDYARWLKRTLNPLLSDPVFFLGHSMGGAIVQELALIDSSILKGIILVSTGPWLRVASKIIDGLSDHFEETIDQIIGYAYAPEADPRLKKEGIKLMKSAGAHVVRGDFLACDHFDRSKEVAGIELPCLVICGKEDILSPPPLSVLLHRAIKHSKLHIIPAAGHMVMIENYPLFNAHLRSFVEKTA